jgi:hypothetical protein
MRVLAMVALAIAASACSKSGVPPETGKAAQICDQRMLRTDEFTGILTAPLVDRKSLAGDIQTCQFLTAGFAAITVSVRPNVGHATMDAWSSGRMPFAAAPLPGVGDQAVWQDTLHEVVAQKNNLLCDIEVRGGESDILATVDVLPKVLGALCNKVFTAFG